MRIRDDDVLLRSSSIENVVEYFKWVHGAILSTGATHVAAILTKDIQEFADVIPFIRQEVEAGVLEVQWHGWTHIDYKNVSKDQIIWDLKSSQNRFREWFGVQFTKFYTPWGANAGHIKQACNECNVDMVDCSNVVEAGHIIEHWGVKDFSDREILIHWWREQDIKELRAIQALDREYLAK